MHARLETTLPGERLVIIIAARNQYSKLHHATTAVQTQSNGPYKILDESGIPDNTSVTVATNWPDALKRLKCDDDSTNPCYTPKQPRPAWPTT